MDDGRNFQFYRTLNFLGQKFKKGEDNKNAGATICLTDWDNDGDLDIISGWFYGGLYVSINKGTKKKPVISNQFTIIKAGGQPLKKVFHGQAQIIDWDGDGKKDLLYSTRTAMKNFAAIVYWCRNIGKNKTPEYAAPQPLLKSGITNQAIAPKYGLPRTLGSAVTANAVDWDNDGNLDLLVGDVIFVETLKDNLTPQEVASFKKISLEKQTLDKKLEQLYRKNDPASKKEITKLQGIYRTLYEKQTAYTSKKHSFKMNGQMWLYERQKIGNSNQK